MKLSTLVIVTLLSIGMGTGCKKDKEQPTASTTTGTINIYHESPGTCSFLPGAVVFVGSGVLNMSVTLFEGESYSQGNIPSGAFEIQVKDFSFLSCSGQFGGGVLDVRLRASSTGCELACAFQ